MSIIPARHPSLHAPAPLLLALEDLQRRAKDRRSERATTRAVRRWLSCR